MEKKVKSITDDSSEYTRARTSVVMLRERTQYSACVLVGLNVRTGVSSGSSRSHYA